MSGCLAENELRPHNFAVAAPENFRREGGGPATRFGTLKIPDYSPDNENEDDDLSADCSTERIDAAASRIRTDLSRLVSKR